MEDETDTPVTKCESECQCARVEARLIALEKAFEVLMTERETRSDAGEWY